MAIHCDDAAEIERKNNDNRALVAAIRECNGRAFLGKLTARPARSSDPLIREWDGAELDDMAADFVLPKYDAELERMIVSLQRGSGELGWDRWMKLQNDIHDRIALLGGRPLLWYFYDEEESERLNENAAIEIVELWNDHTWTIVSFEVPRSIAESESQEDFSRWYASNATSPPDVTAVLVWDFNPDTRASDEDAVDDEAVTASTGNEDASADALYDQRVEDRAKAIGVCPGCGTDIWAEGGANEDCDHSLGCGALTGSAQREAGQP